MASVQEAVAQLSGTGIALADLSRREGGSGRYSTRGATDALERIGTMAEQSVLALLREKLTARAVA